MLSLATQSKAIVAKALVFGKNIPARRVRSDAVPVQKARIVGS
jgi:hypothetical protein